ncbi:hypothetical protein BHE74_00033375 [Ensete ventricosum]|nr:hypothetical protein BHE74_00033375 [Ensete ventricosum]
MWSLDWPRRPPESHQSGCNDVEQPKKKLTTKVRKASCAKKGKVVECSTLGSTRSTSTPVEERGPTHEGFAQGTRRSTTAPDGFEKEGGEGTIDRTPHLPYARHGERHDGMVRGAAA